jgi:hypothetical protein
MVMRLILSVFTIILLLLFDSCNKEVSTSPPETKPENTGKLYVDSDPKGALIFLNGKNTGYKTPDTVPYLNSGIYKLTTKLNLFKDSSEFIDIKNDSLTTVFFDYITNPTMRGRLYVDSNPRGAEIILNDSSTGKTTLFEFNDLLPGIYQIELKKTGYWNKLTTATVMTNKTFRINATLEDTTLFVNYNTSNSGIPSDYINCIAVDQNGNKWMADSYNLIRFDDTNWQIFNPSNSDYPGGNVKSIMAFGDEILVCTIDGLVVLKNGIFQILNSQNGLPSDYVYCCNRDDESTLWVGTDNGLCKYGVEPVIYNTSNSGLPSNSISAVQFDDLGNMWVGTVGGGIAKYDGTDWSVFDSTNTGLPASNKITDIAILNSNFIWVSYNSLGLASPGGTAFYDGINWTTYQSFPSRNVSKIAIQSPDLVWFSNFEDGLTKFENGNWFTYLTSNSKLSSNKDFGVAIDNNNHKWIATYEGGLSKYKGN